MASIDQINSALSTLQFKNTSVTSILEQIAIAVGTVDDNILAEIANSENIITNLLISQQGYGKALYYTGVALQFQYGYNLSINTAINPVTGAPYLNLYYPSIDTNALIISQAAFQASPQSGSIVLYLKVATTSGGVLAPLSAPQLAAFTSYMINFEIVGLPINIISLPANILFFSSIATYLASYDLPTLQSNVQAALVSFQTTFAYNGTFYAGDLETYIKANVPGIRDFYISGTTLDGMAFSDSTNLSSGYFNYDAGTVPAIVYSAVNS
jgi:hypothetical protein